MAKNATPQKYFLPNIKSCNSLPFILANIYRKEKKWDDVLVLNTAGRIACGGSSNLFLWKNKMLFTPSLSEGCVAGTMRNVIFDICKKTGINISERRIFHKDLKEADGIFLSNAISGIKWVESISGVKKIYQMGKSTEILNEIKNY
jgi:branched-chain amino acid aminotransferase